MLWCSGAQASTNALELKRAGSDKLRYIFLRFGPLRGHLYCSNSIELPFEGYARVHDACYSLSLQLLEYGQRSYVTLMILAFKYMNVLYETYEHYS